MRPASAKTPIDSRMSHLEELPRGIIPQSTMAGTISKVPAASASHQVNQVTTILGKPDWSARTNPARAMLELIIAIGTRQMIANLATLEAVANIRRPRDQRRISHAPAKAARTVPMPAEPSSRGDRPALG